MLNPYVLLGTLVGVLLLCAVSFYEGHHYAELQNAKAVADAVTDAVKRTQAQDQVTHDADVAAAAAQVKIQTVIQTQIQKVPVYVTKKANAACVLPRGFVQLHDDSARGVQSVPPAAGSVDAPSTVQLTDLGSAIAANYGQYQVIAQQLRDLQGWIKAQEALRK